MSPNQRYPVRTSVSLFTREWIEILADLPSSVSIAVSLFTREWIEIARQSSQSQASSCLPLYEGVD